MKSVIKRKTCVTLIMLIVAALLLSMVACSNSGSQTGKDEGTKNESQTENNGKDQESTGSDGDNVTLTLWTFADTHHRFFEYVRERFAEDHPNVTVNLELYDSDAMWDKLTVVMASGGDGAPDMADVEQGSFGRFVKNDTFFEPLNDYLEKAGKMDAISKGRQDLYTWEGKIYGLEHALCPVTMMYRKDIFEEKGIEVPLKTWDDFREAAKKLDDGQYMIGLGAAPLLRQDMVDIIYKSTGNDIVTMDGKININTQEYQDIIQMLWDFIYTDKIATTYEVDQDLWNLISDGKVVTYINADWGAGWLKDNCPDLSGKWSMTQLPVMKEGDTPTSVRGGTGLTMLAVSKHKDLCWEFMQLAQLDVDSAVKRYELTNLFPPLIEAFDDQRLYQPDPYFDGFVSAELYRELGKIAPTQSPTWWRHLYYTAFEKFFFDMEEGKITAAEFAKKVEVLVAK